MKYGLHNETCLMDLHNWFMRFYQLIVGLHEYLWISIIPILDVHGYLRISMNKHGRP